MKKILFLTHSFEMPSCRVRVLNLLEKLKQKGYDITCIKFPKKFSERLQIYKSLNHFDIVFIQKRLPSPVDTFILGKLSKKLIYDFDDAIYMKHEKYGKTSSFSSMLKFKTMMTSADIVIAGNRILASYAESFNSDVRIIPSTVETENIPVRDYDKPNDKFIVGWVGGAINLTQLQLLTDVFKKLQKEIPLEVRVISSEPPDMPGVNIKFIPWSLEVQDIEIARFDAGVMPLPDSPFARGKCAYKAIQYMASGVVPVVSDVGVNADVVTDGETGFVANEICDFYEKLKTLHSNPALTKKMGAESRKKARSTYSLDAAAEQLDIIFKEI